MRRLLLITLVAALSLAFVACGDDDDDTNSDTTTTTSSTSSTSTTEAPSSTTTTGSAAADVKVAAAGNLGQILVDAEGRTLYGFKNDSAGTPTCVDTCAATWPPATVTGTPNVDAAIDSGVVVTVEGTEGGQQLKAGSFPLYHYSGDQAAGDTNGQGIGGVWFTVRPDGSLNET